MLFNTVQFIQFFLIIYLVYLCIRPLSWQNLFLLAVSYIFYAYWDWRFFSLLVFITLVNFSFGKSIHFSKGVSRRKALLFICIAVNLAVLAVFKYFSFFASELAQVLNAIGLKADIPTLHIILPLGISFFVLQAMTYPLDIYRGTLKPISSYRDFSLFVAFFPTVSAGPIERAVNLLPQIQSPRHSRYENLCKGAWLFFWGLFKKIFIADNLAKVTGDVFDPSYTPGGLEIFWGMYFFAVQIYADFSGYSDMARGVAKLMGFEILPNFKTPFFSKNIAELWQRWHISLTSWIKDYVYYPLGISDAMRKYGSPSLTILITWALMGLWHGPEGKYFIWGVYHALILIVYSKCKPQLNSIHPKSGAATAVWDAARIFFTFNLFALGLLCFAADSSGHLLKLVAGLFMHFNPSSPINAFWFWSMSAFSLLLLGVEWFQCRAGDREEAVFSWPLATRVVFYYVCFYLIILSGVFSAQKYYYFQF